MDSITSQIIISEITKSDFNSWQKMALKLWTDYDEKDLSKDLETIFDSSTQITFLAKNNKQEAIGFVNMSVRQDYVEGADKSPTGYLEGIFVEEKYRKMGVAKALVKVGEQWLKQNNCTQIGSDTWLSNIDSQKFHERLGFKEEERLVHYIKMIQ